MKRVGIAILGVVAALGLAAVPGGIRAEPADRSFREADSDGAGARDRIGQQSLQAMELIYQGQLEHAGQMIEASAKAAPDDPRPYFMRARLMRERVSEQNAARGSLKPQMKAIHQVLEQCGEVSQKILDRDPNSPLGTLYRGWAKMFKAQLHALAFEHWSAGQQAKAGKKDIDRVVELDPGSGEAHMILGTYYYFAGILPSTLKLAGLVLGIPKGDRARGIQYLQYAGNREGLARYDALGILGAALFGFDGRLEDAVAPFDTLNARFPDNARLIEPVALIDLFFPARLGRNLPRFSRAIEADDPNHDPSMRNAAARLRIYRALTGIFTGRIQEARADLEALHRDPPKQPDWFETDINLYLAEVYLMLGEKDLVRDVYRHASGKPEIRKRLRPMMKLDRAADRDETALTLRLQPAARALHEGRLDDADRELRAIQGKNALYLDFCRGELEFLRGRTAAARSHFQRVVDRRGRWRLLPYFARLRLGEVYRLQGNRGRAGLVLDEAVASQDVKDLIRHVTIARSRYYKQL